MNKSFLIRFVVEYAILTIILLCTKENIAAPIYSAESCARFVIRIRFPSVSKLAFLIDSATPSSIGLRQYEAPIEQTVLRTSIINTTNRSILLLPIYCSILPKVFLAFFGFLKSVFPCGPIGGIIQAPPFAVLYKFPDRFHCSPAAHHVCRLLLLHRHQQQEFYLHSLQRKYAEQ